MDIRNGPGVPVARALAASGGTDRGPPRQEADGPRLVRLLPLSSDAPPVSAQHLLSAVDDGTHEVAFTELGEPHESAGYRHAITHASPFGIQPLYSRPRKC
jgi:hypothetical protein